MMYDHMVKVNGKYYYPGEEVPDIESVAAEEIPPQIRRAIEENAYGEAEEATKYTKAGIAKMNMAELQKLADSIGLENAYAMNLGELRKALINELFE